MAIVMKQFPWSSNGYDVEILNPGDNREFGAALAGLVGEGFVFDDKVVEPAPEPVDDPDVPAEADEPEATPEPVVEPAPEPVATHRKRK